jgi:hypothetical protein
VRRNAVKRLHKDVDFEIDNAGGKKKIFGTLGEACALAVILATCDEQPHNVDVIIRSKQGARALGGGACVERYLENPHASVYERIVIRARGTGPIY